MDMTDRNFAQLQALSVEIFGVSLEPGRADVLERAWGDILAEIRQLRSLDLPDVDPVVVFDPVKAWSSGRAR
jgi:hypothetical protein